LIAFKVAVLADPVIVVACVVPAACTPEVDMDVQLIARAADEKIMNAFLDVFII
jgi:hypothetical protein